MKKVLMTWYGITDLKSSLGLEYTDGPILGALESEDYTDVLILGYTNKEKKETSIDNFDSDLSNAKDDFKSNSPKDVWTFINKYSNTEISHNHYIKWLKSKLNESGKKTDVIFHPVELEHLNDTEGIYEIETKALNIVASYNKEKEVYFFLSPGTPVMAFTWAFVALQHPNLKKHLIASPILHKAPEIIKLPEEWLEWHSRSLDSLDNNECDFDMIFHLFGEQRMPSLLGIKQFKSKKHVFVNTSQYPAKVMKNFLINEAFDELYVDPFNPIDVNDKILAYLKKYDQNLKIGFNLTGGTKLMYAGALSSCKKINATPFYFDGVNNKVIFLNNFKSSPTIDIDSVETFLKLHGNELNISNKGLWDEIPDIKLIGRDELTKNLWKNRRDIASLYKRIYPFVEEDKAFDIANKKIQIKYDKNKNVTINLNDNHFSFENWSSFGKYIMGGWFEEFVYLQLCPLLELGVIKDLRIGLEVSFKEKESNKKLNGFHNLKRISNNTYQEFDLIFTDGKKLYIIECKAGSIKTEYIMKLQNIIRYFGGIEARGILAACFQPNHQVVKKKIEDSSNITFINENNFRDRIISLLS